MIVRFAVVASIESHPRVERGQLVRGDAVHLIGCFGNLNIARLVAERPRLFLGRELDDYWNRLSNPILN